MHLLLRDLNACVRKDSFAYGCSITGSRLNRQHTVYILLEVDITSARQEIRAYRRRTGHPLSLTTLLTGCFARAIDEHKLLHAYRKGRGKVVIFEEVDVTWMVAATVALAAAHVFPGKWYILLGALAGSVTGAMRDAT